MDKNKIEVLSDFFEKHVFPHDLLGSTNVSLFTGAKYFVKGFISEAKDINTIQEILDFFTITEDSKNVNSYEKIIKFFHENKNNSVVENILNLEDKQIELSYLEVLIEYIENYKNNRQIEIEEVYDFCANNGIDTMTIFFAGENSFKIKEIFLSLPENLSIEEKLSQLRFEINKL